MRREDELWPSEVDMEMIPDHRTIIPRSRIHYCGCRLSSGHKELPVSYSGVRADSKSAASMAIVPVGFNTSIQSPTMKEDQELQRYRRMEVGKGREWDVVERSSQISSLKASFKTMLLCPCWKPLATHRLVSYRAGIERKGAGSVRVAYMKLKVLYAVNYVMGVDSCEKAR